MPRCVSKDDLARARGEVVPHRQPGDAPAKKPPHRFQPGNKFGYKHGAYSAAFVQPEEKEQFLALRQEIARDFKNETGPDTAMLDAAEGSDWSRVLEIQAAVNRLVRGCANPVDFLKRYAREKGYDVPGYDRSSATHPYLADRAPLTDEAYEAFKAQYEQELARFTAH